MSLNLKRRGRNGAEGIPSTRRTNETIPADVSVSLWRKRLAVVFKNAEIVNGHSHRFRDTFAVSLLSKGVTLESVSQLLGHQNIKITQRHYSPWVKARQDALDQEIEKALAG